MPHNWFGADPELFKSGLNFAKRFNPFVK